MKNKSIKQLYQDQRGKVSDKWQLYLSIYDQLFFEFRDRNINLLEIGIQNGGSLEIWASYFFRAENLVGCDINHDCHRLSYADKRIAVVIGDANLDSTEKAILSHSQSYDLIMDDGSHRSSDIVKSFSRYFPHLADGGVYIVEDMHCSYWQEFEGGLFAPFSSMTFFKRLADIINYEHWGINRTRCELLAGFSDHYDISFDEIVLTHIHSIEFINSVCVIRKLHAKDNEAGLRQIVGEEALVETDIKSFTNSSAQGLNQSSNIWSARPLPPVEELIQRLGDLAERDGQINDLNHAVAERDGQIGSLAVIREEMLSSTSWQITKPLRLVAHQVKRIRHIWRLSPVLIQRGGGVSSTAIRIIKVLRNQGLTGIKQRIVQAQCHPSNDFENITTEGEAHVIEDDLAEWIGENDTITEEARTALRDQITEFERKPLISLLLMIGNTNTAWLKERIDSIRQQIYPNWELCLATNYSTGETMSILENYAQEDSRIKVAFTDRLGQDDQLDNEVLKLVTGEYCTVIGPDVLLAEMALFWLVERINNSPEAVIICSNEDDIDKCLAEIAPLLNYFGMSDEFKEGGISQMIDRINKILCYRRNHGAGKLFRLILLKLSSRIQHNKSKEHERSHRETERSSVQNIINSRFTVLAPLRIYSLPSPQVRRVNVVTDSVSNSSLFGGVGTALIFAALYANKMGAQLRIVTRTERAHPANVDHILSLYDIKLDNEIQFKFAAFNDHKYELDVSKDEVFITTSWWTTAATLPSVPHASIIYLLQEDERMFYTFGDDRFQCESILSNRDIRFLINTKLLFDYLVETGLDNIAAQGKWFEPAFPAQVFHPRKKAIGGKRKFFFYARPNNPRNLFYLGAEVIEQAITQQVLDLDQWEICLVGKNIPNVTFGNGHVPTKMESLPWSSYADFAGTVDIGLSLMYTPHPSYPPLDLAASGAVVVTNRFANKRDLSGYSPNLICADLDKDSLVEAIREAVTIASDSQLRELNFSNNTLLADWHSSFASAIDELSGAI